MLRKIIVSYYSQFLVILMCATSVSQNTDPLNIITYQVIFIYNMEFYSLVDSSLLCTSKLNQPKKKYLSSRLYLNHYFLPSKGVSLSMSRDLKLSKK